jgi:predicted peptidase
MVFEISYRKEEEKMSTNNENLAVKYAMEQCEYTAPDGKKLKYCRRQMNAALPGATSVLLFLHGAGERGDNNYKQLYHGAAEVISWSEKNQEKVLLLFPQCPEGEQWVNTPWDALSHTMPAESVSLGLAMGMLESEIEKTGADKNRLYISGISMGGYGTWDAISRNPDLFAAAFPVCGGADTAQAPKLTKLPILTFHGDTDTVVPTSRTRDMVAALRAAGSKLITYTEVPNCGHDSWFTAFRDDNSWKWLFSQKK